MSWDAKAKAELSRWAAIPGAAITHTSVTYREVMPCNLESAVRVWHQRRFRFPLIGGLERQGTRGSWWGNLASYDQRDLKQSLTLRVVENGVEMTVNISTALQVWTIGNHVDLLLELAQVRSELTRGPVPEAGLEARAALGWRHACDYRRAARYWQPGSQPAYR
ncbi:hypothetical protein EON81_03070 [bacterium]|nr:MAG: hypothetical protein EON81_03070 [bacterium]